MNFITIPSISLILLMFLSSSFNVILNISNLSLASAFKPIPNQANNNTSLLKPINGQFSSPVGVAIDSKDNIYVVDSGNHRIQKFDKDGTFITKWGTKGSGNGQFSSPVGIGIDTSSDTIYIADSGNHRIQKFDKDGKFISTWRSQDYDPIDVAVDPVGNAYVLVKDNDSDTLHHGRILKYASDGSLITYWSMAFSNSQADFPFFSHPGIAIDHNGSVFASVPSEHSIYETTSDGNHILNWGGNGLTDAKFSYPGDVAVDSFGNVYVIDTGNHRIQEFDNNGKFITKWGSQGSDVGKFSHPSGIAVDSKGSVYVTDAGNNRVEKFTGTSRGNTTETAG